MKLFFSKIKLHSHEPGANRPPGNGSSIEPYRFLSESMFLQALCLERKRAERSRKPFVLMLLDLGQPFSSGNGNNVLDQTVSALFSTFRETDIPGWYKDRSVLGIIFTELGPADKQFVLSALRAKATVALRATLDTEELSRTYISFHYFPDDWKDPDTGHATRAALYPDLAQRAKTKKVASVIKRTIDVIGSAMALIVLSPVFLAIAIAIKLSSPGPILFRQKRIGQYGIPFTFLKFRSMRSGTDSQIHREYTTRFIAGNAPPGVYKITDDPRVTRVGRVIRKTSLDELPQFLNVLRGEMSLVGPRPPIPYEFDAYDIWHRGRLLEVKPGITGLWQVNGRSRLRFDDMVRLDLKYAKAWSIWLDIKILLRTPRAVFSREGAY